MSTECTKKERFHNVDFLRFILAVEIMLFHFGLFFKNSNLFFKTIYNHFGNGFICVEFFFIISGFFLFKNINTSEDTINFVKKKLIRLLPVKYLALGICLICSLCIKNFSFLFNKSIISLVFLNCIGFNSYKTAPVEIWYITVLFWDSLFYFYIHKIFQKKTINLILWIITVTSCAFVLNCKPGSYAGIYENTYIIFNPAVIRGLFGLGIGYFIAMLYTSEFVKTINLKTKLCINIIEIYAVIYLTYYLTISNKVPGKNYLNYIIIFSLLFYLLLIKQGILSNFINHKILATLGKYAYSLYAIHWVIYLITSKTIWHIETFNNHPFTFFITNICIALSASVLIYHLFEKPITKYLKNKYLTKTINI